MADGACVFFDSLNALFEVGIHLLHIAASGNANHKKHRKDEQ
jgi:hypothetical protein